MKTCFCILLIFDRKRRAAAAATGDGSQREDEAVDGVSA